MKTTTKLWTWNFKLYKLTLIKTPTKLMLVGLTFNFMNFITFNCIALMVSMVMSLSSQTIFLNENFDAGIPGSWTKTVGRCPTFPANWNVTTTGYRGGGSYLDGTEFIIVDSDGAACMTSDIDTIDSPSFDASAATTVLVEFDQYYKQCCSSTGKVDVWDGGAWQNVVTYNTNQGTWGAPNQPSIDVSAYKNANMKVRFRYAHAYAWHWAIDNVKVYEPAVAPITLLSFNAKPQNEEVVLHWATASESNNDYFTVEKKVPSKLPQGRGKDWEFVAKVQGAGNSNMPLNYSIIDKTPFPKERVGDGLLYYRLKQTDYDGKTSFSKTIVVQLDKENKLGIQYHPSSKQVEILLFANEKTEVSVSLYNLLGQPLIHANYLLHQGSNTLILDVSTLNKGCYIVEGIKSVEGDAVKKKWMLQ